jgi:hypothetical protein
MDETSGVALALKSGATYLLEDEEGRTHLLIHLPIEEVITNDASGGPVTQALTRGRSLRARSSRNKELE